MDGGKNIQNYHNPQHYANNQNQYDPYLMNQYQKNPNYASCVGLPKNQNYPQMDYPPNKYRPFSGDMDKEQKRFKQEEYRKMLDNQLQERRKDQNSYQNDYNNLNQPHHSFENAINRKSKNEEQMKKEMERKKRLGYGEELKQQIKEKNLQKEKEKQRQIEEDMKYENKIKQQLLEQQYQNSQMQGPEGMKNNYNPIKDPNIESPENCLANPILSSSPNFFVQGQNNINTINSNPNNMNTINSNSMNTINSNNAFQTFQPQITYQENMNSINNNFNNYNNPSNTQPGLQRQPMTPNIYNNNIPNNMQPMQQSGNFNRTQPMNNYYNNQNNNNVGAMLLNEDILQKFVNDQMNIIQEYEKKVESYREDSGNMGDNIRTIKQLVTEKDIAMEKMKKEQENLKQCLGFYPMQSEFNNKIASLLEMILDNKIDRIQRSSQRYNTNTNANKDISNVNSYGYNPMTNPNPNPMTRVSQGSNPYQGLQSRQSNPRVLNVMNSNQFSNQINNNLDVDIQGCYYRSKYENLMKSVRALDDLNPEFKESMEGFSKLVTLNANVPTGRSNNNTSRFYQTWRDNNFSNSNAKSKRLNHIEEEYNPEKESEPNNFTIENNSNVVNKDNVDPSILMSQTFSKYENQSKQQSKPLRIEENKDNNTIINNNSLFNRDENTNDYFCQNGPSVRQPSRRIESAKERFSKEDKDKSLMFNPEADKINIHHSMYTNGNDVFFANSLEEDNTKIDGIHNHYYREDDTINLQDNTISNINTTHVMKNDDTKIIDNKRSIVQEVEDEEDYGDDFEKEKDIEKIEKEKEKEEDKLDLNEYKSIHDSQKFQTQMNFFEDSIVGENVNVKNSRQHLVRPSSPKKKGMANVNKDQTDSLYYNGGGVFQSSEMSMNPIKDSYGDNIINDLDKYRKMALEESGFSNVNLSRFKK